MPAFYIISCIMFLLLNDRVRSATWSASSLQDGHQLYTCAGDNVTLTWKYTKNTGEELSDVEWLYNGHSQELVAIFSHGTFLPTPSFSQRVTLVDNAGIALSMVQVADSGNYSVRVNIDSQDGALHALLHRTVTVHVSEHLLTTDGALHVVQDPDPVYNNATGQWVIQLQCGHFTFRGDPPFYVEWTTPSGHVYNSTSFRQGNFYFHIPMPVETGHYVCSIPAHLANRACLHGNSQNGVEVRVESVEVRLLLLEKENWDLRHTNGELSATVADLASRLTSQNQTMADQASRLSLQSQTMADLASRLTSQNQTMADLASNLTSQSKTVANLTNRLTSQNQDVQQLQQTQSHLSNTTTDLQTRIGKLEDAERNQVAFHAAHLSTTATLHDTPLVFNHVVYNQGNAYNSSTGYFTAPYSGIYFFIAKTATLDTHGTYHYLMVDSNSIDAAYTVSFLNNSYPEQSPVHGVIHLTQGQRVWVKIYTSYLMWSTGSAFTGFLLSRDP